MKQPKHSGMNAEEIAKRIRETVQQVQQGTEAVPLRNADHETVVQAIRTLARNRVSSTLRQLRALHGLSYEDVAAQTGLSKQALFDLEYKERRLSLEELRVVATCYHVSESDILGVDMLSG